MLAWVGDHLLRVINLKYAGRSLKYTMRLVQQQKFSSIIDLQCPKSPKRTPHFMHTVPFSHS